MITTIITTNIPQNSGTIMPQPIPLTPHICPTIPLTSRKNTHFSISNSKKKDQNFQLSMKEDLNSFKNTLENFHSLKYKFQRIFQVHLFPSRSYRKDRRFTFKPKIMACCIYLLKKRYFQRTYSSLQHPFNVPFLLLFLIVWMVGTRHFRMVQNEV
jgi:hypothetical protein